MGKIIFVTYVMIFVMYVGTYNADCQIVAPYTPFKLKKKRGFISKFLFICKDRDRGMVTITFYLQMIAHLFLLLSPFWLIFVYCNDWYLCDGFYTLYKNIFMVIVIVLIGIPTALAVGLHDFMIWRRKKYK